ncbi:uncharacterized protein LOC117192013 [Drosophila miranda]|uniref:uncharacterized protein LOC117192013 n=1 Tax=Drosophila miranda TaxID=7229 RepID=UPI00143F8EB3|nr:uncharacterized protein LOC117192013 [Drosophila miranda]
MSQYFMRSAARFPGHLFPEGSPMPLYPVVPSASSGPTSLVRMACHPDKLPSGLQHTPGAASSCDSWPVRTAAVFPLSGVSNLTLEGLSIGCFAATWNSTPPIASCSFSRFPVDI